MKIKNKFWVLGIIIILSLLLFNIAFADEESAQEMNEVDSEQINLYFFYGEGCPHCADAKPFLEDLKTKYPQLNIIAFEVWNNAENYELFEQMSAACGKSLVGVPTFFIGHKGVIGFDGRENKGKEIENAIIKYIENDEKVDLMHNTGKNLTPCPEEEEKIEKINVPILGELDVTVMSLPMFTIIIGLLDGFNPCSMWVLLFLLTLLVYAGSRKKMLFVGGLFILASGIGYFIFMTAWFNFFKLTNFFGNMRIVIGIAAVVFGLINIKEMFFFKKWVSFTIADKHKPKLFKKMRYLIHEASVTGIIVGIISLALTVNFVELLCTAGFPAIYSKVLEMNHLSAFSNYMYILLYVIMYELDDLIVLGIALWFFKSKKLTDKQGKWLKFIAGIMMLILGLILIFKPALLMF